MLDAYALAVKAAPAFVQPAPDRHAQALVRRFLDVYDRADHYTGVVHVHCRAAGKTSDNTYKLVLQKPSKSAYEILQASVQPASVGTRLVWLGGPKVAVRTRFFGLPVSLQADVTDPRLGNLRGDTMADLNVVSAVAVLRSPSAVVKSLGRRLVADRRCELVELRSPGLLKGIVREVYALDTASGLPMMRELWDAEGVAYRLTVERFELDNGLSPRAFSLE
jgi:hypothetical protein